MVRAHVFISGLVQGVFFRMYTQREAQALGLSGWVKNVYGEKLTMPDSEEKTFTGVEAMFEGEKEKVNEMIAWCWSGSPSANVTDVEVGWEDPKGLRGFEIRH
jgi:acylphosphatase